MTSPPTHHATNPSPRPVAQPASLRRQGSRGVRIAWGVAVSVMGLLLIGAVTLTQWDWNRAKPWLNQAVSEASGRQFAVEGDLSASWHWPQPLEEGWHRWVPGVTVQGTQLVLQDPPGFVRPGKNAEPAPRRAQRWDARRSSSGRCWLVKW